ncbi:BTAD domain-containing putative transcriptional regulator [Fimbriimonas ginsengisoli]|uniref:Transcriptional activator n=1 Tax=Fimbriimonas ginsengisoli Gsoil 348 TaxID=661478 RepID=A0A068NKR8_FIMGI|nr:BTAD domain-containing putative transcriptional regulator [Fimbriimonas ginsengisoli]AIE84178.1 transcriptional activator [Fimbriimonas ginsengisoli Gsoil 348]
MNSIEIGPRLCLFGRPRLLAGGRVIDGFLTKRSAFILARLAISHQRQMSRAQLAEVLWPEDGYDASRLRLRQELSRLRKVLEEYEGILVATGEFIRLDTTDFELDIEEFERCARATRETSDPKRLESNLRRVVEIGSEPFMAEADEDWIRVERIRLNVIRYGALVDLGTAQIEAGNPEEALAMARDAITMVPEREGAHLLAVRALEDLGHRADALSQFDILRSIVKDRRGGRLSTNAEGVAASLVPTRADPAVGLRFQFPAPVEPLYGRDVQLQQVVERLDPSNPEIRLLSILGMGGIGKTHLLRHSCSRLSSPYSGRVAFVDLSDLDDSSLVPTTILHSLGLGYAPTDDPTTRLIRVLSTAPVLLALDNLEQFGPAIAPLLRRLLSEVPALRILAGSRVALQISGEYRLTLPPLPLPHESAERQEAETSPAMRLFLKAVEADQIGPGLRREDWPTISNIVRRMEGVPLGLQLAASRMRTLGPATLLQDLDEGLNLLVNRREDAPERHRSLRNAVVGSFSYLDPKLREALASLSVFRGGWTLDAAEQVCGIADPTRTMERLIDASLVYIATEGPRIRFRMLETIREHAIELLDENKSDLLKQRVVAWLVDRSHLVASELVGDAVRQEIDRLVPEIDNLREALTYSLDHDIESALIFGGNLPSFWLYRTNGYEAHQFYIQLFERCGDAPPSPPLLRAAYGYALIAHFLQTPNRPEVYERGLSIGRQIGNLSYEVKLRVFQAFFAQNSIQYDECRAILEGIDRFVEENDAFESAGFVDRIKGMFLHYQGQPELAIKHFRDATSWFNSRGELFYQVRTRVNFALAALDASDIDLAQAVLAGLDEQAAEIGFTLLVPAIAVAQGRTDLLRGRLDQAVSAFEKSISGWQEMGSTFQEGDVWTALGRTYLEQGRLAEANAAFGNSARLWKTGYPVALAVALCGLAAVQYRIGEPARAARMLAVTRREWADAGAKLIPFHAEFANRLEADLLSTLGIEALETPTLTLEEAVLLGRSLPD